VEQAGDAPRVGTGGTTAGWLVVAGILRRRARAQVARDEDEYATWTELGDFIALSKGHRVAASASVPRRVHKGEVDRARTLATAAKVVSNGYYEPYAEAIRVETPSLPNRMTPRAAGHCAAPGSGERLRRGAAPSCGRTLHHDETALKIGGWLEAIGAVSSVPARFFCCPPCRRRQRRARRTRVHPSGRFLALSDTPGSSAGVFSRIF